MVAVGALSYALLGLVVQKARSGYELRKVFALTPMRRFSNSPGAIYPALARLEDLGYVKATRESGKNPRGRRRFAATPAGRAALRRWVAAPLERADVVDRNAEIMLRLSFLDDACGEAERAPFLSAYRQHLRSYLDELRAYQSSVRGVLSGSAMLALESGIRSVESQVEWVSDALRR
jgi:DNA-binding PadR family transcriptional regulator